MQSELTQSSWVNDVARCLDGVVVDAHPALNVAFALTDEKNESGALFLSDGKCSLAEAVHDTVDLYVELPTSTIVAMQNRVDELVVGYMRGAVKISGDPGTVIAFLKGLSLCARALKGK